jgi:uncharacterized protein YbjT (DUF2867 family)
MRIGVTTPTGHVGRHLVRALVRAGERPTVLLRDPARLDPDLRGLVDAVVIDQLDIASTVAATRGLDALFWVDPAVAGEEPLASYARATAGVTAAVRENGIGRVVFQSSIGAEQRHGFGEIDGLAATEVALDATDADVAHLRCGYFFTNLAFDLDGLRGGDITTILPIDAAMPWVAPRDIAEVAAGRLLGGWSGRVVQAVHGPEDLSWRRAVEIVAAATGVPMTVRRISDEEQRAALLGAGMTQGMADSIMGMSTGPRDGFTPEQPRDATTTTPTTLAAWAYSDLRPLLESGGDD